MRDADTVVSVEIAKLERYMLKVMEHLESRALYHAERGENDEADRRFADFVAVRDLMEAR